MKKLVLVFGAMLVTAGCATTPPSAAPPAVAPTGLVFGTVTYPDQDAPSMLVEFESVEGSRNAVYSLPVSPEPGSVQKGLFAGALPVGVYAFRLATSADAHYVASGIKMPFEIAPRKIVDAGHFNLERGVQRTVVSSSQ